MLNVGVIGSSGYTGEKLIEILLGHPEVRITYVSRKNASAASIAEIFPKFKTRIDLVCGPTDVKSAIGKCDLAFLALPHTASMEIVPELLKAKIRVIDLSADYRLKDARSYELFYGVKHGDKKHIKDAVYGLPELYRNKIKDAQLIANPGCYPSCAILALAPAIALDLADLGSVIIDAKSGVTGAGKKLNEAMLFSEINEDCKAYKVNVHQHIPEINQVLSALASKKANVTFVPHLLPINQGMLETIYFSKRNSRKHSGGLIGAYKRFYKNEPFIRIKEKGQFPRIKDVCGTNFCDIGIYEEGDKAIIIAAIDNLMKGASASAVQNMNIMYGFSETEALL